MARNNSISYGLEDIRRYRQGLMSKEEMHAFEKASMEDPFLADALEGYMEADMTLADQHLQNITQRINKKEEKKEGAVVVAMPKKSFAMWRVAAMVIVIAGAGLLTYKIFDKKDIGAGDSQMATVPTEINPANTPQQSAPQIQEGREIQPSINQNSKHGSIAAKQENDQSTPASPMVSPAVEEQKREDALAVRSEKKSTKDTEITEDLKITDKNDVVALEQVATTKAKAAPPRKNDPSDVGRRLEANISNEFRGTIVTSSNEPLANANLRIDNSNKEVVTDKAGNFSVNSTDTVLNATITSGYYANRRVQLRANTNNNINLGTIQMKQDYEFEKTVDVVGLGSKRARVSDTTNNKPVGGWESFQDYVAKRLGLPVDTTQGEGNGSIAEIEFIVDNNGNPKSIKVLTLTDASKKKAIVDAIKNGPKWANTNKTTRLLIKY